MRLLNFSPKSWLCSISFLFLFYNANGSFQKAEAGVIVEKQFSQKELIEHGINQFKSLSAKEQRLKLREAKKTLKFYRKEKLSGKDVDTDLILQVILGIFIPPLGVYLHEGETNNKFWISVLLTVLGLLIFGFAGILFLGTLPSIVYSLIVILGD